MYLLGQPLTEFQEPILPSNADMLRYYHHLHQVHTVRHSIRKSVSRCLEIWDKAGLPTRSMSLALMQMQNLVDDYEKLLDARSRYDEDLKVIESFREKLKALFFVGTDEATNDCEKSARKLQVASFAKYRRLDKAKKIRIKVEREKKDMIAKMGSQLIVKLERIDAVELMQYLKKNQKVNNFVKDGYESIVKKEQVTDVIKDGYESIVKEEQVTGVEKDGYESICKEEQVPVNAKDGYESIVKDEEMDIFEGKDYQLIVKDNCDIDFEAFEDKAKLKIDLNRNEYYDENYAAYLFEEEWNLRFPVYHDPTVMEAKFHAFASAGVIQQ